MHRALARLALLVLASGALAAPTRGQERMERLFYYVDQESSWESLVAHIDQIDVVAPGGYRVDEDGIVWGEVDPRVLKLAAEHQVEVWPLLVNIGERSFDQELLHELLSNESARASAIRTLVDQARRHGYAGIQIDFENVSIRDRDALTTFYRELADALHAAGKKVSIAVVHRPDEFAGPTTYHKWLLDSWRGGYDVEALADAGDFLTVMTYSQHTRRTPPGPQAGIPWMREVVAWFLHEGVPPEKLSMGIATGSQRWYTSWESRIEPELARSYSEQLSHAWALGHAERRGAEWTWDDTHKVAFTYYPRGGTFEWIFLEDARSFRAKLDVVREFGLRGFSVWVLGPEDPAIWDVLEGEPAAR
jgi:spore germination protein YaaH